MEGVGGGPDVIGDVHEVQQHVDRDAASGGLGADQVELVASAVDQDDPRPAWPEPRKKLPPRPTRLDPYKPLIDEMLRADLDAPRKQRHTVKRIFERLLDEHGADEISYQMVRGYVADRREEIRVQAGRGVVEAFVPQTHKPGAEAEVDFGDVTVRLAGELVTCYLFAFRLSYSGKAVHRIFASAGQEAFFEGHVHALNTLGGVPTGKVRYDNLRAAGRPGAGFSRHRVEAERWTAFRSHYGLEALYCQPGIRGATRRAGSRGRSAGSAATTSSRCPRSRRSPSSTR
ncbi:hypothetical protein ACIQVT_12140 [Streptomyces sp. NPDC100445]|uniref:hypothetical protein n=1 Tax=Streptomyces sp. NPDC100445 TaxID=3366102 RepID=UPI003816B91E